MNSDHRMVVGRIERAGARGKGKCGVRKRLRGEKMLWDSVDEG